VLEVRQRGAAPHAERLAEDAGSLVGRARRQQRSATLEPGLEAIEIERALVQRQPVPARSRLDDTVAERLPQLGDVDLHRLDRPRRRPLRPQLVDQPGRRNDLVRAQQQQCEKRTSLGRAERDLAALLPYHHRTEDAELHHHPVCARSPGPGFGAPGPSSPRMVTLSRPGAEDPAVTWTRRVSDTTIGGQGEAGSSLRPRTLIRLEQTPFNAAPTEGSVR
jgi:hypothetical protein